MTLTIKIQREAAFPSRFLKRGAPLPPDNTAVRMVVFRQLTEAPDDDVINQMLVTLDDVLE